jgi:hypothetical protein
MGGGVMAVRKSRISVALVVEQFVGLSLLAWAGAGVLTLGLVLWGRPAGDAFRIAVLLVGLLVLVGGAAALAGGPIPLDRLAGFWAARSAEGRRLWRTRTGHAPARALALGGLTPFGTAILVAAELLIVGGVLLG